MTITELLAFAQAQEASDLHLSAGLPPMVRVDGTLRKLAAPPLDDAAALALIEAAMTEAQRQAFAEDGESDFSLAVPGVARFRVNAFRQNRGPEAVFRTIPTVLSLRILA